MVSSTINEISNEDAKKALLKFLSDINCLDKLSDWIQNNNVFEILKITRTEIRHSNFLAWLLDPNESHELDDFLFEFLLHLSTIVANEDTIIELLAPKYSQVEIYREWNDIDLLLLFEEKKTVIVIENKIGTHEHKKGKTEDSQLKVYSKTLNTRFPEYTKVLIYLTPDGERPTESEWRIMTYEDLITLIEKVFERKKDTLGDVEKILIDNYIKTVKKNVIMDDKLITLCKEIYAKHKTALDLIFETKDDIQAQVANTIKTFLKGKSKPNDNQINYTEEPGKSKIIFRTSKIKELEEKIEKNEEEKKIECYYEIVTKPNKRGAYVTLNLVYHKINNTKLINDDSIKELKLFMPNSDISTDSWEWKSKRYTSHTFETINDEKVTKWMEEALKCISQNEANNDN